MKRILSTLIFVFAALIMCAQGDWKLAKDKNGVKVYTRTKEGSKLKEFKASSHIKVPMGKFVEELDNISNHKNWMKDVDESDKIGAFEGGVFSYYVLNMPWPVTDRDMVFKVEKTSTENSRGLKITTATEQKEESDDYIRIKEIGGGWKFTDDGNGGTTVDYWFFANPAGHMPAWVINLFIVDGPYESLLNLKEELGGE